MVSVRMCAVGGVWAAWAVWVVLTWCPTEGYNLSPDHYRTMTGPEDTHFGFSVALWSDAAAYKRAVVGAPRGRNSTYGQGDVPLGNIFFCEVVGEVVCLADTRLPTVSGDDKSEAALAADKTTGFGVKTYGMGFGHSLATLKQNVSSLAACAPRYPRVEPKSIQTRGACFVLTQPGQQPHLLLPYNGRVPKVDSVQDAMLGFSAALSDLGNSLIMGGPNAFTGEGMLVNKPLDGSVHSLNRDKKTPDTPTLTLSHTYEGWSVVLGKFDSGSTYFIATSSVNYGNYTGKISFYPKKMLSAVTPLYILYGQEMGAQFGYCLGSADVDGDGVDDLLVGAPLARAGDKLLPDAGKIFLYYSPLDADKLPPSQVSGTDAWGRFGAAVTSLGDVDRDGYDDVAVAAPYAGRNRGGVVYIFNGGAGGLRTPHSQMIEASAFSEGLRGFGFSLDGGLDMDDNGYSDLVIGAAESNTALFIR
nr:integrin alpha-IIb-like [Cherax quadricarinatus]